MPAAKTPSGPVAKRLEKGRFVWPSSANGKVVITPAQLHSSHAGRDGVLMGSGSALAGREIA
jgi:hypothetical protein